MMNKEKRPTPILNLLLLAAFIGAAVFLTARFLPGFIDLIRKPARFKHYLESFGPVSVLVFIAFQTLQVLVAPIPGEFVQVAGGYIYGTFLGIVFSAAGILLGSVAAFFIARGLGFRLLKRIIPERNIERFHFLMNNPKAELIMFLLFLLPGVPKDLLVYIAGLTPIKPLKFLVVCMAARFPAIMASCFLGANIREKDYSTVIIISTVACLLFAAGFVYKDKIMALFGKKRIQTGEIAPKGKGLIRQQTPDKVKE